MATNAHFKDRYTIKVPPNCGSVRDLVSGRVWTALVSLGPKSPVVYLDRSD